jgi:hypothetical protein
MYISKQISEKYDESEQYAAEGYIKRRVRMTTGGVTDTLKQIQQI